MFDIKNHAKKWRDFIIDAVFPIECLGCGRGEDWLCPDCRNKLSYKASQYCLECKIETADGSFCPACRDRHQLDGVIIAGDYDNALLALMIKHLKYWFISDLAALLGDYLAGFIRRGDNEPLAAILKNSLVIAVPLHRKRELWRGFNQARLIADHLAASLDLETGHDNLIRTKNQRPQAKLKEDERKANLKDCFEWRGPSLTGRNAVIIDDVVTTGTTLEECARSLKRAGAQTVWGLVVAKG